jgi:hypothetical protein
MSQFNKYIFITCMSILCASCTKEIEVDLNASSRLLVIEGNVTDAPGPYTIKLSKTVNFSSPNTYPPVSGATVTISDNTGVTELLTETSPGLYQTHSITGVQGNTYTLRVVAEGKQYNAVSTMPYKINLDSMRFDAQTEPGESEETYAIIPLYLDPVEFGNNYRFFFSAHGKVDKLYQVSNDNFGNGTINAQLFFTDSEYVKILKGDTVEVTMLCIEVNTYNYYYTLSQISDGGIIGGATPTNPPSNITGNKALGIFSAYTIQTKKGIAR